MTHSASICHNRTERPSDITVGLAFPTLAAMESFSQLTPVKWNKSLYTPVFADFFSCILQQGVSFYDANKENSSSQWGHRHTCFYKMSIWSSNSVKFHVKTFLLSHTHIHVYMSLMHYEVDSSCSSVNACPKTLWRSLLYQTPELPFHASLEKSSVDPLTTSLIRWGCISGCSSLFVF